jgi:hypothetical protein
VTVDTSAPTLYSSMPADNETGVALTDNIVLNFSEDIALGSGNIVISGGSQTINIDVANHAGQLTVSGSQLTVNPSAALANSSSTYNVQIASGAITDTVGNAYAGISDSSKLDFTTAAPIFSGRTDIVVFDLIEGVSSSHSSRTFNSNFAYTIYIRVDSSSRSLSTDGTGPGPADTWGVWKNAWALGADDRIVLVGSGAPVRAAGTSNVVNRTDAGYGIPWYIPGPSSKKAAWVKLESGGAMFYRYFDNASRRIQLWLDGWQANPNIGEAFSNVYKTAMPVGILTSQGLA